MTVVDRLNVAADDRNQAVWAPVLEKKCKAKVCWTMDKQRWKEARFGSAMFSCRDGACPVCSVRGRKRGKRRLY